MEMAVIHPKTSVSTIVFLGIAVVLLLTGAILVGWIGTNVYQVRQFNKTYNELETIVESWEPPPSDIDANRWREVYGWTRQALVNCCTHPSYCSHEELSRLLEEVRRADQTPHTLERIDWLWYRIAETGPTGKRYIDRFQKARDDIHPYQHL